MKQEMGFFFFLFQQDKTTFPYNAGDVPCYTSGKDLALTIKSKAHRESAEWLL